MFCSHLDGIIPREQVVDLALLVAIDDPDEDVSEIGLWIDVVEFAGLNE